MAARGAPTPIPAAPATSRPASTRTRSRPTAAGRGCTPASRRSSSTSTGSPEPTGCEAITRFGVEMLDARWDAIENHWLAAEHVRRVHRRLPGRRSRAPGTSPRSLTYPALADFPGEVFHSARWNHDYDLRGKRVAVIGTGASAVQFVPEIQPQVADLHLFQRTAHWVLPQVRPPGADSREVGDAATAAARTALCASIEYAIDGGRRCSRSAARGR